MRLGFSAPLLACLVLTSAPLAAQAGARGATHAELELLRPYAEFPRVFVQARLPDGELGTFLIDTGADISVLTTETAERIGLKFADSRGLVSGISEQIEVSFGVVDWIQLGDSLSVANVEVAVGLPGVTDRVDMLPVDGILGNNVWSNFVLDLDYRANLLHLHAPDSVRMPRKSVPMAFEGGHVKAVVQFTTVQHPDQPNAAVVALDTGANEMILIGARAITFDGDYSEGVEPVLGVTTSETLPASALLRQTRRIPLHTVALGGSSVEVDFDARWLDYDRDVASSGLSVRGLVGHDLFEGNRVRFDYAGGLFAITPARSKPVFRDAHATLLAQDIERYGDDPSRWLLRAQLQLGMNELDASQSLLDALLARAADVDPEQIAEARVLAARIRRVHGDLEGSWNYLAPLDATELLEQEELVSVVNGLLLEGRREQARTVAAEALKLHPDEGEAWVAQADVLADEGKLDAAQDALLQAARLAENPDAHLLRRARIALARGDHDGALTMLRSGVRLNPLDGKFLWFYAQLAAAQDPDLVRHDIDQVIARTHPRMRPLDFLTGARAAIGDADDAERLRTEGIERDCGEVTTSPSAANCHAWYDVLALRDLDRAQRLVDEALAQDGERSDFLDTKAMVHLARGELQPALDAAIAAARMAPADPYMLWQAARVAARLSPAPDAPQDLP
jgi:tetratricopeptide (TPR) repeat protein/predicted aspartyl protease